MLPIVKNENFGTFSLYEQHSDKLSDLPLGATYSVWEVSASYGARLSRWTGFGDLLQVLAAALARKRLSPHVRNPIALY